MRLLLDTHALIWTFQDSTLLSANAAQALKDSSNEKIVSTASFWEMTIKFAIGKLRMSETPDNIMERFEREQIATILPIRAVHLRILRVLPYHHKDPFDRIIVSQALAENVALISNDSALDAYGVRRLW